jgi:hypothetical protein
MERGLVRQLLVENFKVNDYKPNHQTTNETNHFLQQIMGYSLVDFRIDLTDTNILNSRQDEYVNFNDEVNLFHLEYNENNLLAKMKVHNGLSISLHHDTLSFNDDFKVVLNQLKKSLQATKKKNQIITIF